MGRPWNAAIACGLKSSPHHRHQADGREDAAGTEKKDALPPSTFSARPNGVSTVSYATLPTTRIRHGLSPGYVSISRLIGASSLWMCAGTSRRGHQGVRERSRAFAVPRARLGDP